jgi:hypothetical protein
MGLQMSGMSPSADEMSLHQFGSDHEVVQGCAHAARAAYSAELPAEWAKDVLEITPYHGAEEVGEGLVVYLNVMVVKGTSQVGDVNRTKDVRDPVGTLVARNGQEQNPAAHVESAGDNAQVNDLGEASTAGRDVPGAYNQVKVAKDRVQALVRQGSESARVLFVVGMLGS